MYLKQIGCYKLLSPQEEIELAKRIQQGDKRASKTSVKSSSLSMFFKSSSDKSISSKF